jgi:RNA polymerase sigma-70 factor (ECF subfamily)
MPPNRSESDSTIESSKSGEVGVNRIDLICNRVGEMDDNGLIAAVAAGDDDALRELFTRHAPWLAARLRRVLPADAVEDVLQDTFLAAWRGAASHAGTGSVGAWLWGIARRRALMWSRDHARAEDYIDGHIPEPREDPAATATRRVDLQHAVERLGPAGHPQRELARLVFVEDRTVADVAAHLGIPEGTVKSRVFSLRRRLQAALRRGGE